MGEAPQVTRVLVVDDERIIADTLALILRSRGYVTRVAYNAQEAIPIAAEFQPHAVISDVVMPGMNGIELAMHLAEHHRECKVLLISGNATTAGLLAESEQRGYHHAILAKPCHPEEILRFVSSCGPIAA